MSEIKPRKCTKCGKELESAAPESVIVCEDCWNEELFGERKKIGVTETKVK